MGRGLDVIKDYCRVGESGPWPLSPKGLLPGKVRKFHLPGSNRYIRITAGR